MIKNYLKIAYRNIRRNFTYSFINIVGLAVGLASCLLIVVYVQHELSFDTFHPDSDRIYRVGYEVSLGSGSKVIASSPYRLAGALQNDFPQLRRVTHFSRLYTDQVKVGEQVFRESKIAFADSTFFEVFRFDFVAGNPETALTRPGQVVITDRIADKYFGTENPVGQQLQLGAPYGDEYLELTVSGVIEEMPSNTHFHMNFLVSMPGGPPVYPEALLYNWGWDSHYTYVVLPESYQANAFRSDLIGFGDKYLDGEWFIQFFAQKAEDIHLYSSLNSEIEANGSIIYVTIFSAVALIILLIACINYMNLATARAAERAREVGVRKAVGAHRGQLIGQFLGESMLTVAFSMLLAVGISELALPLFNELAGKSIELNFFSNGGLLLGFVGLTLIIGILSGTYPAFFLSSFKPVRVLKEAVTSVDRGALILRKGLVTLQFTISIVLIAGTIIVFNQLDFLRSKDLGAETEQVVVIPVQSSAISRNYETIRSELLRHSAIREVTTSSRRIGRDINSGTFYRVVNEAGSEVSSRLSNIWVGWEFFDLYDINLLHGRAFSRALPSDTANTAVVINREATRVLEMDPEQAIGKQIRAGQQITGTIVGVAEDFHFESLYNAIKPMVFFLDPETVSYVSVKIAGQNIPETMETIRSVWKQFDPDRIFISSFLDEELYRTYIAEERFMQVFTIFTLLAIFTACLGIFGLAKFTAGRRTKEIGIRKVLGATAVDIVKLLSGEVVRLTGIAFLIALPIAWFAMTLWLEQFAYKTALDPWIFAAAGLAAGLVAWLTVSWQSLKAATLNPVESLRNE